MTEKEPDLLTLDEIEEIEKLTLRWIFQAVSDFAMESHEIFIGLVYWGKGYKSMTYVTGNHVPSPNPPSR